MLHFGQARGSNGSSIPEAYQLCNRGDRVTIEQYLESCEKGLAACHQASLRLIALRAQFPELRPAELHRMSREGEERLKRERDSGCRCPDVLQ